MIGGGITGAGIARDAAMRGLRVGLVERGDFASGTSSRSSKLIHGGLRYLAQGDISLVIEAARERRCLTEIAPHLALSARMVVPVHGRTAAGLVKLRAGMWSFEKMAKIEAEDRHEIWKRDELLSHIGGLEPDRLQGAAVYTEYITDDARLTLETLKSAKRHGALVANYAPAVNIEEISSAMSGNGGSSSSNGLRVRVRDELSGKEASIEASVVVNAAGPWVDEVRNLGGDCTARIQLTKGIHLVIPRERLPVDDIVVMYAEDRRMAFVVPHGDIVWIGTTDTFYPKPEERPAITREDVDYLLHATNTTWPEARICDDDIRGAWAGVRPLVAQAGKSPSEISRRDEILIEPNGLLSIGGGKLTTYRQMGERVVDQVIERIGRSAEACRTAQVPLVEDGNAAAMARSTVDVGDIDAAIEDECALTVTDVLERRVRANLFAKDNGLGDVESVAEIVGKRAGWNDERRESEVASYRARIADDVAWREGSK
ncbi:MAG: glycerol-3-phosphate dehydrogenase/oxidase [Candidatus Binatia bacterium]|nr:glycerol-3-phosphate dehydrogenase/oxidase [Candidatus Binatia bacterium]